MADGMSFDKYIDNPSGGQVYTNRNMYKRMYRDKFNAVLVREQGQIVYTVFRTEDANDTYYIYMKIPSEVVENFYYDVVIQLYTTVNEKKNNVNLREYAVKFFSNDPAFVYTFAHSFVQNNLFITDLEYKMSMIALRDRAEVKNPKNDVWYVKSLFFAYLTMEKYNLFNRTMLNRHARVYRKSDLYTLVTSADIKVKARQDAQERINRENRKKKEEERRKKEQQRNINARSKITGTSKVSKISNTTKTSKVAKVSKTSKITTMNKPKSN